MLIESSEKLKARETPQSPPRAGAEGSCCLRLKHAFSSSAARRSACRQKAPVAGGAGRELPKIKGTRQAETYKVGPTAPLPGQKAWGAGA